MNVLQFDKNDKSEKPAFVFDLSGDELRIQCAIRTATNRLVFTSTLKLPSEDDFIDLIQARNVQSRPAADDATASETDRITSVKLDNDFFDRHCTEIRYGSGGGNKLTTEQLNKLDPKLGIRQGTIIFLLGVNPVVAPLADDPTLEELLASENSVTLNYALCDDSDKEVVLSSTHIFRDPTADDSLLYQRSQKVRQDRTRATAILTDYGIINKLYNSMIVGVEGFTRTQSQKELSRVPFPFKLVAIQQLFRGAERKNV